jgi:hypothetical protein
MPGSFIAVMSKVFLSANLAVDMRDADTRQVVKALIHKSDW